MRLVVARPSTRALVPTQTSPDYSGRRLAPEPLLREGALASGTVYLGRRDGPLLDAPLVEDLLVLAIGHQGLDRR
jgi:hypothetical protein